MKSVTIPLINQTVVFYCGEKEYDKYLEATDSLDLKEELRGAKGATCGSHVYLGETDINTVMHELSHVSRNVIHHIGSECEELRAYVLGYLSERVPM